MEDCLFCKIVAGQVPSEVVLDRRDLLAFRDINPQAPVHVQIIPKEHLRDLTEVTEAHGDLMAHIAGAVREVTRTEGIDASGFRVVTNVGEDGGQRVFHLHFHVLGGRPMRWPPG